MYIFIVSVCYYDKDGYLRFEPPTDQINGDSVWDFTTEEINYLGGTKRYEFTNIKNNIVVIGSVLSGLIYKSTASDTTSDTRISLIGSRNKVIKDDNLGDLTLTQDRADYELQLGTNVTETIDMSSILVDHIEGSDIITVTDEANGCNLTRYIVKNVTVPLGIDANQSINAWRCTSV